MQRTSVIIVALALIAAVAVGAVIGRMSGGGNEPSSRTRVPAPAITGTPVAPSPVATPATPVASPRAVASPSPGNPSPEPQAEQATPPALSALSDEATPATPPATPATPDASPEASPSASPQSTPVRPSPTPTRPAPTPTQPAPPTPTPTNAPTSSARSLLPVRSTPEIRLGARLIPVQMVDGRLLLEGEDAHVAIARGSAAWSVATDLDGYLGSGYVVAEPDTGVTIDTDVEAKSPELRYHVEFTRAGTYYLAVRGWASDGGGDSVWVGIAGETPTQLQRIAGFERGTWSWSWLADGEPATIEIPAPGRYAMVVWMREDGFALDRIVLSTEPYVPADDDQSPPREKAEASLTTTPEVTDDDVRDPSPTPTKANRDRDERRERATATPTPTPRNVGDGTGGP